ncbi:Rieske 2Fe-2S domain-containing protein [Stieleria sp. TO1_6]|uniref:aromatic ring-hydroxylating oxygenase subunit alpha n=1 Tax=Stieleria tagensis TaxID=2956795 RepID=UPI00209AE817|nr:SRPBCC family protein [Stieleria tagensis]MCO8122439.1 Rieske 2Fe-2S domain-containing protein [Stieleria tagensis]
MFQTQQSLPALLDSSHYTTAAAYERDVTTLRRGSWQLVGCTSMAPDDGDYFAIDRLGVPILVRNDGGHYFAFHNVCAHRSCRLASGSGNSAQIKCPYHGWQYGTDGRTRKIPDAKQFPKFDRESYRLGTFPVRQIGQLLLVHLTEPVEIDSRNDGTTTVGQTISQWNDWLTRRTSKQRWRLVMKRDIDYRCDWKIPIEGSLESYHLDEVHAGTFGSAPSEADCEHHLDDAGTVFETSARESSFLADLEARVLRGISGQFDPTYRHLHVFPNLMASLTDSFTLVYQTFPTGLRQSRMTVFGFARRSERWGWGGRYLAWWLGIAAARLAGRVLDEDAAIFPEVQAGLDAARTPRIFARSEERLYAFQQDWLKRLDERTGETSR